MTAPYSSSRLRLLVVTLVLASLSGVAAQDRAFTLWVTLGDSDQLVEVDAYSFKEIRRITTDPKPHGLATTNLNTGEQWDAPNGWAPLQWIAIDGLRRHGEEELAHEIAARWVAENARVYCQSGKLVEKYNIDEAGQGAGGEYPVQDGFGWTNGILVKLLELYPDLGRQRYEFTGAACGAN